MFTVYFMLFIVQYILSAVYCNLRSDGQSFYDKVTIRLDCHETVRHMCILNQSKQSNWQICTSAHGASAGFFKSFIYERFQIILKRKNGSNIGVSIVQRLVLIHYSAEENTLFHNILITSIATTENDYFLSMCTI